MKGPFTLPPFSLAVNTKGPRTVRAVGGLFLTSG